MRVLMVHPHDITSRHEPWTIRIKNIADEFKKSGHSVKLVSFYLDNSKPIEEINDNNLDVTMLSRRLGWLNLFKNIITIYKKAKWADIIHFQKCFWWAALPCLIAAWVLNKPIHYDWDDWEIKIYYYAKGQSKIAGSFLQTWEKLIPEVVGTISCSSRRLMDECKRQGMPSKNLYEAHVGANLEIFTPEISGMRIREKYNIKYPLVLYLGQLHGGQYAELFIKAAKLVTMHEYEVLFMIVGDGYRLSELKQLSKRLGVENQIIFTGHVEHKYIPEYIAASDVCSACFEDNDITRCKSPLKIAEYMAMAKPIVASNVGEIRRMLGGVGILVQPGDAKELAEGIITFLRDDALRKMTGVLARRRAEAEYNWRVTAGNLLKAYRESIN